MIWIVYAIVLGTLIFATIHDVKTGLIPVFIFPLSGAACTVLNALIIINNPVNWKMDVIMLVAGGALYGIAAVFFVLKKLMGGADVYMLIFIGLSLGFVRMTETVLIACVAGIVLFIIHKLKKKEQKEYPFAPMMLTGFIGSMVFVISQQLSVY